MRDYQNYLPLPAGNVLVLQKEEMLMNYTKEDHTFMICAYQENPYLENCICSILNQSVLGKVKLSTSTPNEYIKGLAKKYSLSLVYNSGKGDAVDNFNFAYAQADTKLVTLCHQDDYYNSLYLETSLFVFSRKQMGAEKNPIFWKPDLLSCRDFL